MIDEFAKQCLHKGLCQHCGALLWNRAGLRRSSMAGTGAVAGQQTFQVQTNRPSRMSSMLCSDGFWGLVEKAAEDLDPTDAARASISARVLPDLRVGVSVESQK